MSTCLNARGGLLCGTKKLDAKGIGFCSRPWPSGLLRRPCVCFGGMGSSCFSVGRLCFVSCSLAAVPGVMNLFTSGKNILFQLGQSSGEQKISQLLPLSPRCRNSCMHFRAWGSSPGREVFCDSDTSVPASALRRPDQECQWEVGSVTSILPTSWSLCLR